MLSAIIAHMKKVAKLIIINADGDYLLLYRNNHPIFGDDPDLPGGTLELGESTKAAMVREVQEEVGLTVDAASAKQMYSGVGYSQHGAHYSLFVITLNTMPEISMSWEHARHEWLSKNDFLSIVKNAKDSYMHMVYDTL